MPSQPIASGHRVDLAYGGLGITPLIDDTPLYKFLPSEFAKELISQGRLRIGTLFSFRALEQHGAARGDALEGSTGALAIVDHASIQPGAVLPPFFAKMISPPRTGQPVRLRNWIFEVAANDEDYFVFSLTSVADRRLFRAFDCDTCVRISKPRSFFTTLSEAISDRLMVCDDPVASMKSVIYGSRRGRYSEAFDHPGPFVKPSSYAYQREVRMLWTPAARPIEPFVTTVPTLSGFCELHSSEQRTLGG